MARTSLFLTLRSAVLRNLTLAMACVALGALVPIQSAAQTTLLSWGTGVLMRSGSSWIPTPVTSVTDVKSVTGGGNGFTMMLKYDGTVWGQGENGYYYMGIGPVGYATVPTQAIGLTGVIQLDSKGMSLALKADGTVWEAGAHPTSDDSTVISDVFVQNTFLSNIAQVSSGPDHCLALTQDGEVLAWGGNSTGQLGNGPGPDKWLPHSVGGLPTIKQVQAAQQSSVALGQDGTVWTWGSNIRGQIGDGTRDNRTTPFQVPGLPFITEISARYEHVLALAQDGTIWAWGNNPDGRLGDGGINFPWGLAPIQISGLTNVLHIAAGNGNSLAVKQDGTVWKWGADTIYQPSYNTYDNSYVPIQITGLTGVIRVYASGNSSFAVKMPDAAIIAPNVSGKPGDTSKLTATLKQTSNSAFIPGATITFKVDGATVGTAVTNAKGLATFSWKVSGAIAAGGHPIAAEFGGNANYGAASGAAVFTMNAVPAVIAVPNFAGKPGESLKLTATLKRTADNVNIINTPLLFKVDGATIGTVTTNNSGAVSLTWVANVAAGVHALTAETSGVTACVASPGTATITIAKVPTSVSVTNAGGIVGQKISLVGKLTKTSGGTALAGQTLQFKVNSAPVGSAVTASSGIATLKNYQPTAAGVWNLTAEFAGDPAFEASSNSGSLTVIPSGTTLVVPAKTVKLGKTIALKATLRRSSDNTILVGKLVTISLDGLVLVTVLTDSTGTANFNYLAPAAGGIGTRTIGASFTGDSDYNAITGSGILTINP